MKKLFKLFPLVGLLFAASLFVGCSDDDDDNRSTEALILEMTFEEDVVVQQPVISGTNIMFYVSPDAEGVDLEELKPRIKVSEKASVIPASGEAVDFSEGVVEFTVTAENEDYETVYTVSWQRLGKYDFEEWVPENPAASSEDEYVYAPAGGWGSSNIGALFLMNMSDPKTGEPYADRLVVTESTKADAYSGNKAARIETIYTKGLEGGAWIPSIPKVTTGTLFLGKFDISAIFKGTLGATKFGVSYDKKPLKLKGYYKYQPGEVFYRATGMDDCHAAEIEEGTVDQCAINAILYEIENDDDEYLTGLNVYNEDNGKLVARAELKDGAAKAEYTAFDLDFEYKYGKTFDPSKKYRLAIICASSKWGDEFSGAPGSVLFVDDIELISE